MRAVFFVLSDTSVWSPRKLSILTIKKLYLLYQRIPIEFILILKPTSLAWRRSGMYVVRSTGISATVSPNTGLPFLSLYFGRIMGSYQLQRAENFQGNLRLVKTAPLTALAVPPSLRFETAFVCTLSKQVSSGSTYPKDMLFAFIFLTLEAGSPWLKQHTLCRV